MCLVFPLKFVNLVVYMTTPASQPPRIDSWLLRQFLQNVANEGRTSTWTAEGRERLRRASEEALAVLRPVTTNEPISADRLREVVAPVRRVLEDHILFALPAGEAHDQASAHKFISTVRYAAASSREHALVLIPDSFTGTSATIIDPMPAVELLTKHIERWPGVLFWSRSGAAAFAGINEAMGLYLRLEAEFASGPPAIDNILRGYKEPKQSRRLLHLSDLHFGSTSAKQNVARLREQLLRETGDISRAVITGDLINTSSDADDPDFADFKDFRRWLAVEVGSEVIVVPGNHDERWLGNRLWGLGDNRNAVADLSWSKVVVDSTLKCVFLCFDSARKGMAGTGSVSTAQLDDVAREFETVCAHTPEAEAYQRIALLHHHPAPYDALRDYLVQPLPQGGMLEQERLLALEDADGFLEWCRRLKVRLIMHGHKHLQRLRVGDKRNPSIVGCGTSLGAENKPLSYNVLTVDPSAKRIALAMYADVGNGFRPLATSLHL
jgi:predicted phosphodiesterase